MKYKVNIEKVQNVDEIREYWSKEDYIQLLEKFDYPDAEDSDLENFRELLFMAISVFEYKLGEQLSDGQIDQISNDMLIDTVCEEYPEMELQSTLFHVNQLLFKAFNGKFPSSSATIIHCSISPENKDADQNLSKKSVLRLLNDGLSDRNIIKRLFE